MKIRLTSEEMRALTIAAGWILEPEAGPSDLIQQDLLSAWLKLLRLQAAELEAEADRANGAAIRGTFR